MNQMSSMLKESNERMKILMKALMGEGNVRLGVIAAAQREAEIQIRDINLFLQAYAISSKNKRMIAGMEKMNLMDETTAVDLGLDSPSADKVKCPGCNRLITRDECLDTSGSNTPYEECDGCEIGRATKAKLLPPK